MKNEFVRKAWSKDLDVEVNKIMKSIKIAFGINLSGIQASKIVAWKSKINQNQINHKQLLEILGGKI